MGYRSAWKHHWCPFQLWKQLYNKASECGNWPSIETLVPHPKCIKYFLNLSKLTQARAPEKHFFFLTTLICNHQCPSVNKTPFILHQGWKVGLLKETKVSLADFLVKSGLLYVSFYQKSLPLFKILKKM